MIFNKNMNKNMNKISKIIAVLLIVLGTAFLGGCIKGDLDTPPVLTPNANLTSNMSLTGLYKFYKDSMASSFGLIKKNIIIKGIVVANDESGNIYKALYIQDDSAGIEMALNQTNLFSTYKLGQRVYITCQGLYLGSYGGVMELGYNNANAIGQIPTTYIKTHVFLDSFPGTPPAPKLMAIPTTALPNAALCTLVELDSVHFSTADVGQPFSSSTASTSHTIQDKNGNPIILYTSNYANFAANLVPGGIGNITGILSNYNGTWQLYIRDLNDLVGF